MENGESSPEYQDVLQRREDAASETTAILLF